MADRTGQKPLPRLEVERIINNRLIEEYSQLRWTPGFCLDRMPWERIQELTQVGTEESLGQLGRHPRDIAAYWTFRAQKLAEYASMGDYVKITKLDYTSRCGENGLIHAEAPPPETDGQPHITFKPNDFPYHFEEGVQHHNVWCTRPLSPEQLQQVIEEYCDGWDVLYFKNPESLASIPSVWHGHIVSRRKQ